MAWVTCHYFSDALRVSTAMTVLLPQSTRAQIGLHGVAGDEPPPVLYLLHGLSDDETIWTRRTSIERYAAEKGLAVVMPRAGRSFYADEAYGSAHWTHLTQELPVLVSSFFRVSTRRQDTFVAGLSMGGYGAFKCALREPERFAAAASLSGALDVRAPGLRDDLPHVWADQEPAADDDLFALLAQRDPATLPALYVACGTEDFLYEDNLRWIEAARARGVPVHADTDRPGDHDWAYWDATVQDVLDWLPIGKP